MRIHRFKYYYLGVDVRILLPSIPDSIVQIAYFYTCDHIFAISERSLLQCIMGYIPEIFTAYGLIAPCKESDFISSKSLTASSLVRVRRCCTVPHPCMRGNCRRGRVEAASMRAGGSCVGGEFVETGLFDANHNRHEVDCLRA